MAHDYTMINCKAETDKKLYKNKGYNEQKDVIGSYFSSSEIWTYKLYV